MLSRCHTLIYQCQTTVLSLLPQVRGHGGSSRRRHVMYIRCTRQFYGSAVIVVHPTSSSAKGFVLGVSVGVASATNLYKTQHLGLCPIAPVLTNCTQGMKKCGIPQTDKRDSLQIVYRHVARTKRNGHSEFTSPNLSIPIMSLFPAPSLGRMMSVPSAPEEMGRGKRVDEVVGGYAKWRNFPEPKYIAGSIGEHRSGDARRSHFGCEASSLCCQFFLRAQVGLDASEKVGLRGSHIRHVERVSHCCCPACTDLRFDIRDYYVGDELMTFGVG